MFHDWDKYAPVVIDGLVTLGPDDAADALAAAHHRVDGSFLATAATAECVDVDGEGTGDFLTSLAIDFEHVSRDPLRARAELLVVGDSESAGVFEVTVFRNG